MADDLTDAANAGIGDHGLHFTNHQWNGSISNGEPFTVRWNESLNGRAAELGLFRVMYPYDGVMTYELVSNLTESISSTACTWTPDSLKDGLYALWLTTTEGDNPNWTISPPWRPTTKNHSFHWAAPVGIPIVTLLGVYSIALCVYIMYHRQKKARREKEDQLLSADDQSGRHPSVSSAVTVQTYDESDVPKKPSISFFTHSPFGSRMNSLDVDPLTVHPRPDCYCKVREPEKTVGDLRTELRRYSMA